MRGAPESIKTAMMFGGFYPNPGAASVAQVSHFTAFMAEFIGTFALVFLIFSFTDGANLGKPHEGMVPFFIGLTVTIIICVIAPLTQAGLNPARDLSPRLFSWLAGWGQAAFPDTHYGFLTVYVLAPLLAGIAAALSFKKLVRPLLRAGEIGD